MAGIRERESLCLLEIGPCDLHTACRNEEQAGLCPTGILGAQEGRGVCRPEDTCGPGPPPAKTAMLQQRHTVCLPSFTCRYYLNGSDAFRLKLLLPLASEDAAAAQQLDALSLTQAPYTP